MKRYRRSVVVSFFYCSNRVLDGTVGGKEREGGRNGLYFEIQRDPFVSLAGLVVIGFK